jgi:ATP-dependent 26S proteasome regulatory subunit
MSNYVFGSMPTRTRLGGSIMASIPALGIGTLDENTLFWFIKNMFHSTPAQNDTVGIFRWSIPSGLQYFTRETTYNVRSGTGDDIRAIDEFQAMSMIRDLTIARTNVTLSLSPVGEDSNVRTTPSFLVRHVSRGVVSWLDAFQNVRDGAILFLPDFHQMWHQPPHLRSLKETFIALEASPAGMPNKIIMSFPPGQDVPVEIQTLMYVDQFDSPDVNEFESLIYFWLSEQADTRSGATRDAFFRRHGFHINTLNEEDSTKVSDFLNPDDRVENEHGALCWTTTCVAHSITSLAQALTGLTWSEGQHTLIMAFQNSGYLSVAEVQMAKITYLNSHQALSVHHPDTLPSYADVGGYEAVKDYISRHMSMFTQENKQRAIDLGVPNFKGCLFVGIPGCLTGDTTLLYKRGHRPAGRPITLEKLYKRFNNIQFSGKGGDKKWKDLTEPTYLHSMQDNGLVFYNKIVDVIDSGIKKVIKVTFSNGASLTMTPEHLVATPIDGFVEAGSLGIGDVVVSRGSMLPRKHGGRHLERQSKRILINVKYHPFGSSKIVCGYEYTRVGRSRLVIEALLNDITYLNYIYLLKHDEESLSRFFFLRPELNVHHIDRNPMNDEITNLMIIPKVEHDRLHAQLENFDVEYLQNVTVVSIEDAGEQHTYDIQMESPNNNFAANNIIVHNSGKSLVARATARESGMLACELDVGKVMDKYVGGSESNMQRVIEVMEKAAGNDGLVVIMDEVEKQLAGTSNAGASDAGTSSRVHRSFLTWLNDRKKPVVIFMTANQIDQIPPEFMRPGRIDTVFFFDLPGPQARLAILNVHLNKYSSVPKTLNIEETAFEKLANFTGAEIEQLVKECVLAIMHGESETISDELIDSLVPTMKIQAHTHATAIEALRNRAREFRPADEEEIEGLIHPHQPGILSLRRNQVDTDFDPNEEVDLGL